MACSKVFSSGRGLSSTVYAVLFRLSLLCSLANASFPFSAHNSAAMVGEIILLCCRVEYKDKKRPLVKSEPETTIHVDHLFYILCSCASLFDWRCLPWFIVCCTVI